MESLPASRVLVAWVALGVVLLIGGFLIGRAAGTSDPATLTKAPVVAVRADPAMPALVKPAPFAIPKRPQR